MKDLCWCGSGQTVDACCGPYLAGERPAPTAVALMRSRYSAFCQGNIDYLMSTRDPKQRQPDDRATLRQTLNTTQWVNLLVLKTQKGQARDRTGIVEFVAAYRPKPLWVATTMPSAQASEALEIGQMHEKSKFVREGDRWFYTDGQILPPYRPHRAQPCWCGSGKKYKLCHG